ncbi:MAG: hypothetical protein IPP15_06080 [Saprospiraceae bacterium]|uniref:Uncharacterized protein n=1 Tax=Candidatus Opimibacter skivensis TaxID=2982028 RepID=A0A9D7XM91_9BACT|nr:hypothetical protein [Candidatus Opimibacter skivensis]
MRHIYGTGCLRPQTCTAISGSLQYLYSATTPSPKNENKDSPPDDNNPVPYYVQN